MSGRSFFVRGRDRHDRHIRKFDSASPLDAAREYLIAYVEDWRGGRFKRLDLELTVWGTESEEQAADRWYGSVIASGRERTAQEFTYQFVEVGPKLIRKRFRMADKLIRALRGISQQTRTL